MFPEEADLCDFLPAHARDVPITNGILRQDNVITQLSRLSRGRRHADVRL